MLLNIILLLLFIFKGYDFIFKLVKKMVEIMKIIGTKNKSSFKKLIHSDNKIRNSKTLNNFKNKKSKKNIKKSPKRISNSKKINFI